MVARRSTASTASTARSSPYRPLPHSAFLCESFGILRVDDRHFQLGSRRRSGHVCVAGVRVPRRPCLLASAAKMAAADADATRRGDRARENNPTEIGRARRAAHDSAGCACNPGVRKLTVTRRGFWQRDGSCGTPDLAATLLRNFQPVCGFAGCLLSSGSGVMPR